MEIAPFTPELSGAEPGSADDEAELEPLAAAGEAGAAEAAAEDDEDEERLGPGEAKTDEELFHETIVLLFASPEPLSDGRLIELLGRPDKARALAACERIGQALADAGLPLVVRKIAGGWRLLTDPRFGAVVERLRAGARPERISAAGLETLAIVAYRQPVTKAEIEAIRGVQAGPILRTLVDRGLVRVTGRADLPGAPLQYGTTKEFLERFGLPSLKDLPRDGELVEE